jgi:hypothetical protein
MTELMSCHACKEYIDRRARLCHNCGSEQSGIIRFLPHASLILSVLLLVWATVQFALSSSMALNSDVPLLESKLKELNDSKQALAEEFRYSIRQYELAQNNLKGGMVNLSEFVEKRKTLLDVKERFLLAERMSKLLTHQLGEVSKPFYLRMINYLICSEPYAKNLEQLRDEELQATDEDGDEKDSKEQVEQPGSNKDLNEEGTRERPERAGRDVKEEAEKGK